MKDKISIIGAGSWGTTLAVIFAKNQIDVTLCSVFKEHNRAMVKDRENRLFLKGAKFPNNLKIAPSLKQALEGQVIVIAIPVKYLRSFTKKIKKQKIKFSKKTFISVSKGIEAKSLKRVSQILTEELGKVNLAVLSGPNIAKEVLRGVPSTAVVACKSQILAKRLQRLFTTPTFRVYAHKDVIGVELGGALKNIIAIACGIADGLGFGTNTKAALVTRGLAEITRLGKRLGAVPQTFWGISGLGDLATTCFSSDSRNRFVGEQLGKGKKIKDILDRMEMVAEGLETVKSAYNLSKKLNVDMPITKEVYSMVYQNKSSKKAVNDLMKRALKAERVG
ncbi:MAG: NAD(P)-dependent glycerol-3-phosphate dehydrogenase [Candidatus Omnitrophica bacterium]|nr:NAD(P)-dependent glycerol-3-phosphate dehydrogenase [Candidatus Omnitrophota bacterium]